MISAKGKIWMGVLPLVALGLVTWYYLGAGPLTRHPHGKQRPGMVWVDIKTYEVPGGWGFDILANNGDTSRGMHIHQIWIPGIPGHKPFATKDDALTVGHLMVDQLKSGKFPPHVSYMDMKNAGVKL